MEEDFYLSGGEGGSEGEGSKARLNRAGARSAFPVWYGISGSVESRQAPLLSAFVHFHSPALCSVSERYIHLRYNLHPYRQLVLPSFYSAMKLCRIIYVFFSVFKTFIKPYNWLAKKNYSKHVSSFLLGSAL